MLCVWIGKSTYHYFLNKNIPESSIVGIQEGGHYAGDVACVINGYHPYKVGKVSIYIDESPLVYNFSIGKQSFEHPFSISTEALTNGKHTIKTVVVDGTYHKNKVVNNYSVTVDNTPLQAAFLAQSNEFKVFQGRTLHVQFQVNKPLKSAKITLFSKEYDCFPEAEKSLVYESYIPIECEVKPNEYPVVIDCMDLVDNSISLNGKVQIVPFPFKKQRLHVSAKKIEEEKAAGASQKLLDDQLEELSKKSPRKKLWNGAFFVPTEVQWIATEYGVVRTTQEKGKYTHKALDIANTPKSVIWASQDGIVVVKDRYVYSGNTVVIDHGYGILSLFFHLDSFADSIEVGQKIKRGSPIGKLGKTGYASGYHLHWEMRINNIPVDPMQWTKEL